MRDWIEHIVAQAEMSFHFPKPAISTCSQILHSTRELCIKQLLDLFKNQSHCVKLNFSYPYIRNKIHEHAKDIFT